MVIVAEAVNVLPGHTSSQVKLVPLTEHSITRVESNDFFWNIVYLSEVIVEISALIHPKTLKLSLNNTFSVTPTAKF